MMVLGNLLCTSSKVILVVHIVCELFLCLVVPVLISRYIGTAAPSLILHLKAFIPNLFFQLKNSTIVTLHRL